MSGKRCLKCGLNRCDYDPDDERWGYQKETAGAIEAAASTGGQLMPPIMGAAAFLLAENLQANYIDVMKAALYLRFYTT